MDHDPKAESRAIQKRERGRVYQQQSENAFLKLLPANHSINAMR